MKGLSEALSTLIIASSIIAVSLLIFYMSMALINDQMAMSEYGYIKSMFVEIANNYHLILQGNNYVSAKPHRYVGVGYHINNTVEMIIKYNSTIPEYVKYLNILIEQADPSGTAYAGSHYYVVHIYMYLVNGEVLEIHWKLEDNYGVTDPAPTIIEYIYYSNGSTIQLFDTSTGSATPLVSLPYRAILYPGDKILVRMNDNYNDNNYGDGYFPVLFTMNGFKSYNYFTEGGGFYHLTSIIITNTRTSTSGEIQHYKPPNSNTQYNIDYATLLFTDSIIYSITDSSGTTTGTINNIHSELYHIDIVDPAPASITATVYKPYVTCRRVVYGNKTPDNYCSFIVKDVRLIPCIYEYYENGATHLVFDNQRFYVTIYELTSGSQSSYVIRMIYVKINPILIGCGQASLKIIPYRDIMYKKININYLELIEYDTIHNRVIKSRIISIPDPEATTMIYIVKQVNVVIG